MVMFLALHPNSLNSVVLLEHLAMLLTSTLAGASITGETIVFYLYLFKFSIIRIRKYAIRMFL